MTWRRVHDATELGQSLAELRKERGMSQQDLAGWLDVDRTTVVRLESGSLGALARLTDALAVLGADLVVLPRHAEIAVTGDQPAQDDGTTEGAAAQIKTDATRESRTRR